MLPYATLQDAETAINRSLTATETLWFNYTVNKSDYILYLHNILFLFIIFTIVPLFYVLIELVFRDYVAGYKIQPKGYRYQKKLLQQLRDGSISNGGSYASASDIKSE